MTSKTMKIVLLSALTSLSYCWGNDSDKIEIVLGGCPFKITPNLASALRRLRLEGKDRRVWADAICINQQDVSERESQVAKMELIYRRAEQVLVWLGEEADDSDQAMELLRWISGPVTDPTDTVIDTWLGRTSKRDINEVFASFQNTADRRKWEAVARLLSRPYWSRVWVIQEVVLAKRVQVLCGSSSISWDTLAESLVFWENNEFASHFLYLEMRVTEHRRAGNILSMKALRMPMVKISNLDLLNIFRKSQCKDPRDKIYGALGICDPAVRRRISVNYSLSRNDVYTYTSKAIIEASQKLDILCDCENPDPNTGLPSWVYDLDTTTFTNELLPMNAMESAEGAQYSFKDLDSGSTALVAKGIVMDELSEVCSASFVHDEVRVLEEARQLAMKVLPEPSSSPPEAETRSAFWRTITADEDLEGYPASEEFIAEALQDVVQHDPNDAIPAIDLSKWPRTSFNIRVHSTLFERRFFATRSGMIGVGPRDAKPGDTIVRLFGTALPLVMSKHGDHWRLVGTTYTHGIMHRKAERIEGSVQQNFEIH